MDDALQQVARGRGVISINLISVLLALLAFIVGIFAIAPGAVVEEHVQKNEPQRGYMIIAYCIVALTVAIAFLAGVLA
jgi:hypothetical protein